MNNFIIDLLRFKDKEFLAVIHISIIYEIKICIFLQ